MENKKLPTELDIEELLKAVEQAPKEVISKKTAEEQVENKIFQFVMFYDIKPGYHKVPKRLIHIMYKYWSKEKMPRNAFTYEFHKVFTGKENTTNYFLNKSVATLLKQHESDKPKKIDYTKSKTYQKLFADYLNHYNIKPGNLYVECDLLYYLFDMFVTKKRRASIGFFKFFSLIANKFNKKDLGYGVTWFGVDESIKQHLPQEVVERWRQGRAKYAKGIKKEHAKKLSENGKRSKQIIYKKE